MLRWFPLAFFSAAATLLGVLLYEGKKEEVSAMVGKPFPIVDAKLFGESSAPEVPAQLTLYNLFASWCVPCAAEIPVLETLAKTKGIAIYGIAWGDKPKAISAFLEKYGNPYHRIYRDTKGQWAIALGMRGVPETFVVDDAGVIRLHVSGEIKPDDIDAINAMLQ